MADSFVNWINQQRAVRGWSIRETARRAGLSHTPIANILAGQGRPGLVVYGGIARAFGVALEEVLRIAGELQPTLEDQRASDPALEEGCLLLSRLSPGDRQTALRLLRGLALTDAESTEAVPVRETEQTFEQGEYGEEDWRETVWRLIAEVPIEEAEARAQYIISAARRRAEELERGG